VDAIVDAAGDATAACDADGIRHHSFLELRGQPHFWIRRGGSSLPVARHSNTALGGIPQNGRKRTKALSRRAPPVDACAP
jgi:hypothetical protein